MKRRDFLKGIPVAAGAVAFAPALFLKAEVPAAMGRMDSFRLLQTDADFVELALRNRNGKITQMIKIPRDKEHWNVSDGVVSSKKRIEFPEYHGEDIVVDEAVVYLDGQEAFSAPLDRSVNMMEGTTAMLDLSMQIT